MLEFLSKPGLAGLPGVLIGAWALVSIGCSSPTAKNGRIKNSSAGSRFVMCAKEPWNDTGQKLRKDRCYRLTARVKEGEEYKDDTLPCTPDGPNSFLGRAFNAVGRDATFPLNPVRWIGPGRIKRLRVLHDRDGKRASFLTLIAAIGRNDREDNVYVIGSGGTFKAHHSGELVVFSNDWPGGPGGEGDPSRFDQSKSYANNHGRLVVTIEEL